LKTNKEMAIDKPYHVLVTHSQLARPAIQKLEDIGAQLTMMDGEITEARLLDALARQAPQAILMRGNPPINATVLSHAPGLRVIAKHGAGVDSVDLEAATRQGVLVMVAGDANAPAVAEHTIAMILALGRDLPALDRRTHEGHWDRDIYKGREIAGRTLGLVGFGRIGRRVAATARCLGMSVVALVRHAATVDPDLARTVGSLDELLGQSDIVSLHVPLSDQTRGMMDKRALSLMRQGSLLINTSRGALVDEAALAEALHSGHLAGAAVDTLAHEPPQADSPLLQAPNLLITPHVAAMTTAAILRMGLGAADNIAAVLTGRQADPANIANPAVLERLK
jgi:D-3-phosphoglycerate dehydrogenase